MKKLCFCLILFLFLIPITLAKEEQEESNGEVIARISFFNNSVTTRNLQEKLHNISYQLENIKVRVQLSYYDESIIKQLELLPYRKIEILEKDYKILLKRYGLYDDLEQADYKGVPLKEVLIKTKRKNLLLLKDLPYQITMF